MSQNISAPAFSKWRGRWVGFMATIGGWSLMNLAVALFSLNLAEIEKYGDVSYWFREVSGWLSGVDLAAYGVISLGPWLGFVLIYYPLTVRRQNRWGGWTRTQLLVTIIAWIGGILLLPISGLAAL